jgi:response regulator RpfG family c-di-GMP phosphodiesterase
MEQPVRSLREAGADANAVMIPPIPTPPLAVTVVEDEPMAQDVLVRAARSWQFQCQAASTAEQALALLERNPTPVVVTDLRMPGRGGVWLIREIRKRWPEVGIIVLTAGHDTDATSECLRAGAHHYFLKPIKLDEFRHVLETTWRTCRDDQANRRHVSDLRRAVRKQTRRVRRTFLSAITSLARAMEERDPYTAGHSRRVTYYVRQLARAIGLDRKQLRLLSLAAQLHDLGKVAVPDEILHKPAGLTREEFDVVRLHPVTGERILAPVLRNRVVLAAIRGHHERFDGTGYPDRLRGHQIPLLARLITIADCFDALTTSRAYRGALPVQDALAILRDGAGTQFEADFVKVFVQLAPRLDPGDSRSGIIMQV